MASIAAIGMCVVLYALFESVGFHDPGHGALLAGISTGLLVNLMQQMSVLG
eukprot:CAMPEP_0176133588 /NCGR_PEP_ID=MMETSP0120_2-20121206/67723_1 /TAXON_ID=160619 /ORGANISM="Kryptoperidinium foliaceum, Strain CCMP 1326" /LENGTH=50 /DNA_ID=CAMNT_0017469179 /DNA_START=35 /DNA_END=183 /DNA_ORIENTATION=-